MGEWVLEFALFVVSPPVLTPFDARLLLDVLLTDLMERL